MKTPIPNALFLFLALVGVAVADLPKKAPITKYTGLWTNSPFTAKPPPPENAPENNPLDEYALIGVSSLGLKNYLVTLINKKKPDEPRIYVETNRESKGFKILEVIRKAGDPLGTEVLMQAGSMRGKVSYDQKLLTIAAPAAKPAQPQQPGQAAPQIPGQQPLAPGLRQPRPRVVPPPVPPPGQVQPVQVQPGQVQPGQVQPVQIPQLQQVHPEQGNQQNRGNFNNQRPTRRGN